MNSSGAIELARRGFKLFPITPGAKAPPLVREWQKVATSDERQVAAWAAQYPGCNWGIHCDGLVVIDVDPKNGGEESLAKLQKETFLEATYEVDTPSGGTHLYYRCPPGVAVRNGVSRLGAGIDIRSTGGYVLAAGSRTAAGTYTVFADEPIATCDEGIIARLARVSEKPDRPATDAPAIQTNADVAAQRAIEYLASLPIVEEGGRNVACLNAARKIADFGVTRDAAIPIMVENFRTIPPMDEAEIVTTVRSSYNNRQQPVGAESPEGMGFDVIPPEGEQSTAEPTVPPETDDLLHPADVDPDDVLKADYLVKHVLDKQSNALLYGKWSVGKTFVVLDIAASIALGLKWFGQNVRQGRVLYLGYEGMRGMKKRMIALREKYPQLKNAKTPFRWAALHYPLTEDKGKAQVQQRIARFRKLYGASPDLVIIDPLMNALGGDDSDAELMGKLNQYVTEIMRLYKCTVLRVHHTGHQAEERARGHSSLPAGVDTEIRVDRDQITMTKQKDDEALRFDWDLKRVAVGVDTDGEQVTTCVVEQIEDNPASPRLTRSLREIMTRLVEQVGDGKSFTATEFKAYCPENWTAQQCAVARNELTRKGWLSKDDKCFIVHANGPAPQFEQET